MSKPSILQKLKETRSEDDPLSDASIQDFKNRITGSGIYDRSKDGGLDKWELSKLQTDNRARIRKLMKNGKVYNMHDGPIYNRSKDGGLSEEENEKLLNTIAIRDRSQDGGLSEGEFETPPASIYNRSKDGGLSEGEFEKLLNTIAIHDRSQDGGLGKGETTVLNDYSKMWLIANLLGSNHPDTIKQRNNNPNWEDPISIDDETGSITYTLGPEIFKYKKN